MKLKAIVFAAFGLALSTQATAKFENAVDLYDQGKLEQAQELFESEKDNYEALRYLARITMKQDLDDAEDWIEKSLELNNKDPETYFFRGIIMGEQAGNAIFSALSYAEKSLYSFKKAVELEPENPKYHDGLMQFYLSAPGIAGGDKALAKEQLQKIKALDTEKGMHSEFDYLLKTDQHDLLPAHAEKALIAYPDKPDFYFRAGMMAVHNEEFTKAYDLFNLAISKPTISKEERRSRLIALYQLGEVTTKTKQHYSEGIAAFKQYLAEYEYSNGMPEIHWAEFRMANVMELANRKDEAKAIYNKLKGVEDKHLQKLLKKKKL